MVMIVGWLGTACIVLAYILVSSGRLSGKSPAYQLLNLVGAIMLGVDVWIAGSMPAVTLQVVWATVAIISLLRFGSGSLKRK